MSEIIQSYETRPGALRSLWAGFVRASERVFQPIENLSYVLVVKQISRLLDHIDPLSHRIEGTLFKKILQVTLFPLFMTATLVIGFQLVKNGYTTQTFIASIGNPSAAVTLSELCQSASRNARTAALV